MATNLQAFNYESHDVRTVDLDGDVWFVATDIADVLGYRDAANMVRNLDDDEAATHNVSSRSENNVEQNRELTIINESGLYSAILSSRKPEAKAFRRWVTREVLPAIRKTGQYISPFLQLKLADQQQALLHKWLAAKEFKTPRWDEARRPYSIGGIHHTYDTLHRRVILLARAIFQTQKDRDTFERALVMQLSLAVRDVKSKTEALTWFNGVLSRFEHEAIAHIVKAQDRTISAGASHPDLG